MQFPTFLQKMNDAAGRVLALNCGVAPPVPISGRDFVAVLQKSAHEAGFERPTPALLYAIRDLAASTNPVTRYVLPKMHFEQQTGTRIETIGAERVAA